VARAKKLNKPTDGRKSEKKCAIKSKIADRIVDKANLNSYIIFVFVLKHANTVLRPPTVCFANAMQRGDFGIMVGPESSSGSVVFLGKDDWPLGAARQAMILGSHKVGTSGITINVYQERIKNGIQKSHAGFPGQRILPQDRRTDNS